MQIVELADAGVARLQHLQIGPRGDGLELVGVEHASKRVHAAAPGPEVVGIGGGMRTNELGAAGQRPLMGVRVQIDHARQHVTIEALEVVPVLRLLRVNRGDHAVVADLDVGGREPTLRLVQVRHAIATGNCGRTSRLPLHHDFAPLDDGLDRIAPQPVGEVFVAAHVQDDDVGLLARLQRADRILPSDGLRGAERGGANGFFDRQALQAAGELDDELHAGEPAAGTEVGADAERQPLRQQIARGNGTWMGHGEIDGGHDHADHARLGQQTRLVRRREVEVVDRDALQFGGQSCAAPL